MIKLLEKYRKYDYLNTESSRPKVKILVSYIKPAFLFKTSILTPIHLGRDVEKHESKDGTQSDAAIKWLHENCIGDNDFEGNISKYNRRIGFFTGTYWAWKNYEKLGDPEYFGSFGYRKLLMPDALKNLDNYDVILPKTQTFKKTLEEQFIAHHGKDMLDNMFKVIKAVYPNEYDDVAEYLHGHTGYFMEMYIAKKEIFFNFCEWLHKLLPGLLNKKYFGEGALSPVDVFLGLNDSRDIAFILERLTGYYLYKLTKQEGIKYKEVEVFETEKYANKSAMVSEIIARIKKNIKYGVKGEIVHNDAYFISVVNDVKLYEKCVSLNPFVVNNKNNHLVFLDNTKESKPVSVSYNNFLDNYDYNKDAWFVFCHNDWELLQDIDPITANLDKNSLYGPIGSKLFRKGRMVVRASKGFCYETKRDGSENKTCGEWPEKKVMVDTVDCQCLIVHSSLVKKYNLRFDEKFAWHLYAEDFCINALLSHDIKTYAIGIACCHHSDAGFTTDIFQGYKEALAYFNTKYPNHLFGGTVSCIGGEDYEEYAWIDFVKILLKGTRDIIRNGKSDN